MVTGWIVCHCGQDIPAYLATAHVKPNGAVCDGIIEAVHVPGICLECRLGTHSDSFLATIEAIRLELHGSLA